ncbi:MAG: hypothetical protein IT385_13580 [Deltaproteobacteria bacterium]|nr:hypothetical protein [Deltaproteobacteria bacterium]
MSRALGFGILVASLCASAHAVAAPSVLYDVSRPPPASTGWIRVHTGLTFADTLTLADNSAQLDGEGAPGMVLGVGAHWRTTRIDLGVLFESSSSFYFKQIAQEFPTGGQFRATANLRWRYIEDAWGALFMRLTPGLMVFRHADAVRQQVALLDGSSMPGVDTHSVGFSLGFDFGLLIYINDDVALSFDLDIVSGTTTLGTSRGEIDFGLVRGFFTAGVEIRM